MASPTLTAAQAHALFDILTHHETYAEIQQFHDPHAIKEYGPPFTSEDTVSTSPMLQALFTKFALTLPGLRDVPESVWVERCAPLLEKLGAAELSESYDKGSIGTRKSLSTAVSVVLEHPARGYLGGIRKKEIPRDREWDTSNPDDVLLAWDCFVQDVIYGRRIDEMFENVVQSDKLDDHPLLVQAAHRYILVNVASFMHHTFVLSPEGPYLQRLITNVHRLIPYTLVRQSLRIGNAATMINAMVKLLLAKMSVYSITNWIGLSKGADEGMNLLQQIISTILGWDISDFQKRAARIEKNKEGLRKEHFSHIKEYLQKDREFHEECRSRSVQEERSIIDIIFDDSTAPDLNKEQHALAMDYFSIQLSIRDREELGKVICKSNPDIFTQIIRDIVAAYEPIIRNMHNAVDLPGSMTDVENFMNDFIKLSKVQKSNKKDEKDEKEENNGSSVEDYLDLLMKHVGSLHKFLHQFAKNGPDTVEWYKEYLKHIAKEFRQETDNPMNGSKEIHENGTLNEGMPELSEAAAGDMTISLNELVSELPDGDRTTVLTLLDSHAEYLSQLRVFSHARMKSTLALDSSTTFGPGTYLQRWQDLMGSALITPSTASGPVRTGNSETVKEKTIIDIDGGVIGQRIQAKETQELPKAPEVAEVAKICGPGFRKILQEHGKA